VAVAVFGDFLAAAQAHLEVATAIDDSMIFSPDAVAVDLHRLIAALARYCDDLAPCDEVEASSRSDLHPWERAVIDMGTALHLAGECLSRRADKPSGSETGAFKPGRVQHLEAAATALAAGRDLLHTHFAIEPDGLVRARSEWASAITSTSVTRALAHEIARWSAALAPFTARLAASAALEALPRRPGTAVWEETYGEFASASQWLRAVGAAAHGALDADPAQPADAELLSVIPAAAPPQQLHSRSSGETVPELCQGISVSATRLRAVMQEMEDQARWSPDVTSGGWQWMAQAAAVTSHLSELLLRALADGNGQLADPPFSSVQLSDAAELMAGMRTVWSQADTTWDAIITETRLLPTPAMTEASNLVLRLGRLVWDDPSWTPAHSRRAQPRPLAALAPDPATIRLLLAAVHQSVDAMADVAKADISAVQAASRAGRLYVPTRSLPPESFAVPRPFAPAPASRCDALREAYAAALSASIKAARGLDVLAAQGTPSRALALARAAASAQSNRRGAQARQEDDGSPVTRSSARNPVGPYNASARGCGPVEQAIRDRGVSDPVTLLRAAAIDKAARRLITQAGRRTPTPNSLDRSPGGQRAAANAAQMAAQSFPRGPTTGPSPGQLLRSAPQAARADTRTPRRARQLSWPGRAQLACCSWRSPSPPCSSLQPGGYLPGRTLFRIMDHTPVGSCQPGNTTVIRYQGRQPANSSDAARSE
jgi:hypothetical protein